MIKKILIADDHSAIRTGLKSILSAKISNLEFGEAKNGDEVMRMMLGSKQEDWHVLILDIGLKGSNGIEILKTLVKNGLKTRVLVFSIYPEEQMGVRCLKNGAYGYLNKAASNEEIVKAVETLLQGRRYITESIASNVINLVSDLNEIPPHHKLSDREYEVLLLIGMGKTVSEISAELNLGISTINTYRARILKKMNFQNNAGIISYVIKNDLEPF